MVLDFLVRLAQQELPIRVESVHEVDCAFTLQAAGLIDAELANEGGAGHGYALIRGITHAGRAALQRKDEGEPLA